MAHPSPPDPLLEGAPGPCAPLASGADYAAGTDAAGDPVAPADVGADPVRLPGDIAIPLHGNASHGRARAGEGGFVILDGRKLAKLLDPLACR